MYKTILMKRLFSNQLLLITAQYEDKVLKRTYNYFNFYKLVCALADPQRSFQDLFYPSQIKFLRGYRREKNIFIWGIFRPKGLDKIIAPGAEQTRGSMGRKNLRHDFCWLMPPNAHTRVFFEIIMEYLISIRMFIIIMMLPDSINVMGIMPM